VAERLSACIREQDVLSRVGGDEFVVLMPGVFDRTDADAMSARLREAVDAPFLVSGAEITISASVGVHLALSTSDPDQALRAADHAMYAMKHAGGGRVSRPPSTVPVHPGRHRSEV
jgi:diguanylate cyclase (GGDEF)-like protein